MNDVFDVKKDIEFKDADEHIVLIVWLLSFLNEYSFITISDAKKAIAADEFLTKLQMSLSNSKPKE